MRALAVALGFVILLVIPAAAQTARINAANAKFAELLAKGDFEGIGQLYLTTANAFPPGSPIVKGRPAIIAMWQKAAAQITDLKLTTLDIKRLGPTSLREIGTFAFKNKEANPREVAGKYVVIWQRERGDWKIETDIWNDGK